MTTQSSQSLDYLCHFSLFLLLFLLFTDTIKAKKKVTDTHSSISLIKINPWRNKPLLINLHSMLSVIRSRIDKSKSHVRPLSWLQKAFDWISGDFLASKPMKAGLDAGFWLPRTSSMFLLECPQVHIKVANLGRYGVGGGFYLRASL